MEEEWIDWHRKGGEFTGTLAMEKTRRNGAITGASERTSTWRQGTAEDSAVRLCPYTGTLVQQGEWG